MSSASPDAGVTLTVAEGGELHAIGEPDERIVIDRLDPSAPWSTILVEGGFVELRHADVLGGGDPLDRSPYRTGALLVRGEPGATEPSGRLGVYDVLIDDSATQGVRLEAMGAFTDASSGLSIEHAALHPISAEVEAAASIPRDSWFSTNERILLTTENVVARDTTLPAFESYTPYLVGEPGSVAELRVAAPEGGLAVLTIEPWVRMQFQPGSVMWVGAESSDGQPRGALVARGDLEEIIQLGSANAAPSAGDWLGLYFAAPVSPVNELYWVRVSHAGGTSSIASSSCPSDGQPNDAAAIRIFGEPPALFIESSEISESAGHGIDRGWQSDTAIDFVLENNFFQVSGCRQTVPRDASGGCPDEPVCE
jgi:hypothetical protein